MSSIAPTAVLLANGPTVIDEVPIAPYPKFMLPIANRPLFEYQVSILVAGGVKELIVCVSRDCETAFNALMSTLQGYPVKVRCITQTAPRGTGGCLKSIESFISGDLFWVLGADLFIDTNLTLMLEFHKKQKLMATVAAIQEADPPWGFERVQCDDLGNVQTIHRYHPVQNRRSRFKPLGLYLFDRQILKVIPEDGFFDLKEQLFPKLYHSSSAVKIYEIKDHWRTITSLDNYMGANRDVLLKRMAFAALMDPDLESFGKAFGGVNGTLLAPLVMADSIRLGRDVTLIGPTVLGKNVAVGDTAVLNACLIFPGAQIGAGARLTNCIVAENAVIEAGVEIRDRTLLGEIGSADSKQGVLSSASDTIPGETEKNRKGLISHRRGYLRWKRGFDIAFSLSVLILLSPLMVLIAMAIKLDSPGKVIFRQKRCGWNGEDFTMFKFRTMVSNAEDIKREIQHMNEVDGPMFKIASDPRVTRVGHYLRSTNLDEVPQFFNILMGAMALVGPRPLSWDEMRFNPRWRDQRITVPPGLIGLWQLKSHQKPSFSDWIHNDFKYVRECSVILDLKILMLSMVQAVKGVFSLVAKAVQGKQVTQES